MTSVALFFRLKAKPGRESDVEKFLTSALPLVHDESSTAAWFAIRFDASTYGIFEAFDDESGRQAHLTGKVAQALFKQAPDLFIQEPKFEEVDVLADKLPNAEAPSKDLPPHAYAP